jgi:DNA-binding PadR family transcriptional regulator
MFDSETPNRGGRFGARADGMRRAGWMGQEGRGFRGGDGRGQGRGRRPRIFDSGELRLVLLKLIADTPRHGYDLIRAIEELTGGAYAPSPGIVYPTLTLLGEMGLIGEHAAEGARKLFAITPEGVAHLEQRSAEVTALLARLAALGDLQQRTDSAPIRRAMHNLRNVLQHKLGSGLDDDRLHAAVALLDETAQKIERL